MSRRRHMTAQARFLPSRSVHPRLPRKADDTRVVTPSRRAIACAVVLFWALCCVLPASSDAAELILRRGPGLSAGQRADLRARAGVTHKRTLTVRDAELVTVPDASARRALAALNGDPRVIYAAPNARLRLAATGTTTDPYLPFQWDLEQGNDAD